MPHDLLIADIGGTSSRWAHLAADGTSRSWPEGGGVLPGFNPVGGDGAAFAGAILGHFTSAAPAVLKGGSVMIYGAGCGTPDRCDRMRAVIVEIFPSAAVEVRSDLLGAARAVHGSRAGMVLILGTGMNAAWYDGAALHEPLPSLGYLLGDEGSGADLGRTLLNALFRDRLAPAAIQRLFPEGAPSLVAVIERVYRSASPARELAAFARVLADHLDDASVNTLVAGRFDVLVALLAHFFPLGQRGELKAVGSVAFGFQGVLEERLRSKGMSLTGVERDPLPGLVRYHRSLLQ